MPVVSDQAFHPRLRGSDRLDPEGGTAIPRAIDLDVTGSQVYIAGYTALAGRYTSATFALDVASGTLLWQRDGGDHTALDTLAVSDPIAVNPDDGQVTVATADEAPFPWRRLTLTTYSASGGLPWIATGRSDDERRPEVGSVYDPVTGQILLVGTSSERYTAVGYDARGQLVSTHRSPGTAAPFDVATAAVSDGTGSLVVTGTSREDYLTVSFALT